MCYFRMLAAIPGFFISSLFVYLLLPVLGTRLDVEVLQNITYVDSMLTTFILWVAVAPLAAVGASLRKRNNK